MAQPFLTLARAQAAVRLANAEHDVQVRLSDGVYRLTQPLVFTALDGGRAGHTVTWVAAEGAHPVLSGAIRCTGWKLFDKARNLYVTETPRGLDARQLWAEDHLLRRGSMELSRKEVEFTRDGIVLKGAKLPPMGDARRLEVESTGFFTDRISPVASTDGTTLRMQEPAWQNNIWGYDSMSSPYHPELSHLLLVNALPLVTRRASGLSTQPRASCI